MTCCQAEIFFESFNTALFFLGVVRRGSSSCGHQISVIVAASATVRSRSVARWRGAAVSSDGWPKQRIKTTSEGRKIALEFGGGERGIRVTGAKKEACATGCVTRKLLCTTSSRSADSAFSAARSVTRTLRHATCDARGTYLHDQRLCVTRRHRAHRPFFHRSWPGHPGHEARSSIRPEL